jgi:hypothetical protein
MDRIVKVREAAQAMCCSEETVRRRCRRGLVAARRIGGGDWLINLTKTDPTLYKEVEPPALARRRLGNQLGG